MKRPFKNRSDEGTSANEAPTGERLNDEREDGAPAEVFITLNELLDDTNAAGDDDSLMLAFDDEPIEALLYGVSSPGPSSADYYVRSEQLLKSILSAAEEGETPTAIRLSAELRRDEIPLSLTVCEELLKFLASLLPIPPGETVEHDLSDLGGLLQRIWDLEDGRTDAGLRKEAGTLLEKWYERQERYGEARRIIVKLARLYRKDGNFEDAAGMINSYGFTYWLERDLRRAAPIFRKAAELFDREGQLHRSANARANYWMCRIESHGQHDLDELKEELERLARSLCGSSYWQERKIHLLRAKLAERDGRLDASIQHVERAIHLTREKRSVYTRMDTDYLWRLKLRLASEDRDVQESV
jgi:tetratricopeptide (TPR) repeat protein